MVRERVRNLAVDLQGSAHQPIGLSEIFPLCLDQPEEVQRLELVRVDTEDLLVESLGLPQTTRLMQRERPAHRLANTVQSNGTHLAARYCSFTSRSDPSWDADTLTCGEPNPIKSSRPARSKLC